MDRFTDKVGVITDGRSGRGPAPTFGGWPARLTTRTVIASGDEDG
jgi:hypothetical protein